MADDADVIIVGAGLAGLVAAAELAEAGRRTLILEQEPEQALGGQAFWSLGGLFLVNSPEQRRLRIHDSHALALQDWMGTAAFDREEDHWPRAWAEAYVDFAAGEKRRWLTARGLRLFPVVGWAERGGYNATGHGNSVPRFHIAWGTGHGVLAPFLARVQAAAADDRVALRFRHRVDELIATAGTITGVRGSVLEPSAVERGRPSSRGIVGQFELRAQAVIVSSGGIGGNHALVRQHWPARLGSAPGNLLCGVPDCVDGRMLTIAAAAGGSLINGDRMWHYVEGVRNWNPLWSGHAIRLIPGPSALWLDAHGRRLPPPLYPGFDTLGTLAHLRRTGFDHSWFLMTQRMLAREMSLSGSEQNPDITSGSWRQVLKRVRAGMPAPVRAFLEQGEDFIAERELPALVARMNALTGGAPTIDPATLEHEIGARDAQLDNAFCKDPQIIAIRNARSFLGDRLVRSTPLHRLLDPRAGPLIAVRLRVLTRKTLGGLQTDLDSRVLGGAGAAARPVPGLYAAGEAAGFGGGGMHGYRALEGTFLGGCIFSGRAAGRAAAKAVG